MVNRISRCEEADLFIAWMAISLAFTIIFLSPNGFLSTNFRIDPLLALLFFVISLFTVGIGFVLHEMAHKFTAMKFGYYAEFRKDNLMLLVAVALAALVGVVFAAPGATIVNAYSGYGKSVSREENGKISAAGPLVNLILCIPFAAILIYGGTQLGSGTNLYSLIGMIGLQVNAMIAAFNMLPVSVLDGRKVLAWNKVVFIVLIVTAFGAMVLSFYPHIL